MNNSAIEQESSHLLKVQMHKLSKHTRFEAYKEHTEIWIGTWIKRTLLAEGMAERCKMKDRMWQLIGSGCFTAEERLLVMGKAFEEGSDIATIVQRLEDAAAVRVEERREAV